MKGKYRVIIQNKKIKYDFEIKRSITIIRGDSATGKTALVDMIREYYENGTDSGIDLSCKKICAVLEGRNWKRNLELFNDCIVFIDEGNAFVASKEFAREVQNSDNYFVIVTRESLPSLPYAEDSNSGYQFFADVCCKKNLSCVSAEGKSNIFRYIQQYKTGEVLVVADGAAFGPEMEKVMQFIQVQGNITLYLPESFEWIILKSNVINDSEIQRILSEPWEFAESR